MNILFDDSCVTSIFSLNISISKYTHANMVSALNIISKVEILKPNAIKMLLHLLSYINRIFDIKSPMDELIYPVIWRCSAKW